MYSCIHVYQVYTLVSIRTQAESTPLPAAPPIDWDMLAYELFNDEISGQDCQLWWINHAHPSINHAPWNIEEEQRFSEIVEQYSKRDWCSIAKDLGTGRTAITCLMHYQRLLNPEIVQR